MILWRAADDAHVSDSCAFAESREAAEAYMRNPGFGGGRLFRCEVEPSHVLDLAGAADPMAALLGALGRERGYGAIGVDELVPRVASALCEAGYQWVRVAESYPADTVTWIYVGGPLGDEPELELG